MACSVGEKTNKGCILTMRQSGIIIRFACVAIATLFVFATLMPTIVDAREISRSHHYKKGKNSHRYSRSVKGYFPFAHGYSEYVVDARTGKILHQVNASEPRYPASLTKMMTLYLTFDALKKGRLRMDQELPVSRHAASQSPTTLGLRAGDQIPVRKAIESVVVRSANDSAVVLAEALGGTEEKFASMMTVRARNLGMRNTTYRNASGLPNPGQISTARDMAALGLALRRDFPEYYPFFKLQEFTYNGRNYPGHNRVLNRFDGADGIKTGYTNASGFNLVSSARRDGVTVVAVVMGGKTSRARDDQMVALLEDTFDSMGHQSARGDARHRPTPPTVPDASSGEEEEFANVVDNPANDADLADADTEGTTNTSPATPSAPAAAPAKIMAAAQAAPAAKPMTTPAPAVVKPTTPFVNPSAATGPVKTSGVVASDVAPNAGWGIQVGAFSEPDQAKTAALKAMQLSGIPETTGRVAVTDDGAAVHRARVVNLEESAAKNACRRLLASNNACFVFRATGAAL